MMADHPIKQILLDAREYWDHPGTPSNIRENFLKNHTMWNHRPRAEVYSSATESKLVYHTCKSRFCTSCGQRATEEWKKDLKATLPDVPYVEITLPCHRNSGRSFSKIATSCTDVNVPVTLVLHFEHRS
jgi:hypothetical protein